MVVYLIDQLASDVSHTALHVTTRVSGSLVPHSASTYLGSSSTQLRQPFAARR